MLKKSENRNLFIILFTGLTVGVMALFYNIYEPWRPIGPELIPDSSFSTPAATTEWSGWNEWTRLTPDGGYRGSPGVVLTTSSNQNGIIRFTVRDLTNVPAFRVSLRAAAQEIIRGKEGYHVPRAIFFYEDAGKKSLFSLHHGVMDIRNDTGWRYYKDFFPVPTNATLARLHIQNLGVAGVMRIDDISIIPVCERPSAPWWKLFFGILWTTAFILCLFALRPWKRQYGFLIMATLTLIMIGIVLPGKFLDDSIEKTAHTIRSFIPKPVASPPAQIVNAAPGKSGVTKPAKPKEEPTAPPPATVVEETHVFGHLILFSLLAFLSALSWISAPFVLKRAGAVFSGLVFFASATEVLQFIASERSAGLSDLRIDTLGMTVAVAAVLILRNIQRLIRRN